MGALLDLFDEAMRGDGMQHLPLNRDHARNAGPIPDQHRDPFDRMIAAQAFVERLSVTTRDHEIATFGNRTLW